MKFIAASIGTDKPFDSRQLPLVPTTDKLLAAAAGNIIEFVAISGEGVMLAAVLLS